MKKYLIITAIFVFILLLIGCPVEEGKSGGGDSGSSGSLSVTTSDTEVDTTTATTDATATDSVTVGTGTVSGTVNDDAEVTITQSDGTTQTTTTSQNDPDFIFEDVPEGETTIEITTGEGTTTQEIQVVEGETTEVNPFGSTQEIEKSLRVRVYEVTNNGWSTNVSDIQIDNPLGDYFYSKEINVPTRDFQEGFPSVTDKFEWFGLIYEGEITAHTTGTYNFKLLCDDGAILYINDQIVVNGNGVHAPATFNGNIDLTAGEKYSFKLKYFQGPRYQISLVLEAQLPDEGMKLFNMDDF